MSIAFNQPFYLFFWLFIPLIWFLLLRSPYGPKTKKYRGIIGGMRTVLVLILGLLLAEPRLMEKSDQVNLFYVIDDSESIGQGEKQKVVNWIKTVAPQANAEDLSGMVVFGKSPSLESSLQAALVPQEIRSQVNAHFSNIYDALQMSIGQFPPEGKNRILLFSDGNQNTKEAMDMAFLAQSLGVEIYPIPLAGWFEQNEVFVEKLKSPNRIELETPFDIEVVINSTLDEEGNLIITKNGKLFLNETVPLVAGKSVFTYVDTLNEPGLAVYKATLNTKSDTAFQNNEGISFTQATKKAKVLYLAQPERSTIPLLNALQSQGVLADRVSVEHLPVELHELLNYSTLIFDNVSGQDLPQTAMENVEKFVKDMGGGLIMVGGPQSFGAGHFVKTPIENLLPVYLDASKMEVPSLAIILIIDKSSSMASVIEEQRKNNVFGITLASKTKLESAKIAAFASVEVLNPTDQVGVLAFNERFEWVVPLTLAKEQKKIAQRLSTLVAYGGTNLYPGLKNSFEALRRVEAIKKHIFILSDGDTKEEDFKSLLRQIRREKITVSTISIGAGGGIQLLKDLARWGGGRDYHTEDPTQIPRIFVNETKIVTKELIREQELGLTARNSSEIFNGISVGQIPSVQGLVQTHPKPGAQVHFETEEGPLMVTWQYGLGRSVAFTSDLSGRWSKGWVEWDQFNQFASQMVKWVRKQDTLQNFQMEIKKQETEGIFWVDVTTPEGRFVNHLELQINVLFPNGEQQLIDLEQKAPGAYSTAFPAIDIGEYFATLIRLQDGISIPVETTGFGIPYTDEFLNHTINFPLLDRIAEVTHGKRLSPETPPDGLFLTDSDRIIWGKSLWPFLAVTFVLLLIGDVAFRKFSKLFF